MKSTVWLAALLLMLVIFVVGCDGKTTQVSDKTEESSSSTTLGTQEASEEQPDAPDSETPTSKGQKTFTVVDETQGRGIRPEDQRFEATILVTETSDSSLMALTNELKNHYSEHFETFDEVRFYIFDDRTAASKFLIVPVGEAGDLDMLVVASYFLDKKNGMDVLYRNEDGTPRKLKDFTQ